MLERLPAIFAAIYIGSVLGAALFCTANMEKIQKSLIRHNRTNADLSPFEQQCILFVCASFFIFIPLINTFVAAGTVVGVMSFMEKHFKKK